MGFSVSHDLARHWLQGVSALEHIIALSLKGSDVAGSQALAFSHPMLADPDPQKPAVSLLLFAKE